jgi:hypothetical protein
MLVVLELEQVVEGIFEEERRMLQPSAHEPFSWVLMKLEPLVFCPVG